MDKHKRFAGQMRVNQDTLPQFDHNDSESDPTNNSYKLTADGCMDRWNEPRQEFFRSQRRNTSIPSNHVEFNERKMMNNVALLARHGQYPRPDETIEYFIVRNINLIQQYGG